MQPERPRPPVELGPKGHYRLPALGQIKAVVCSGSTPPIRIHLVLETGHELDLPLTQAQAEDLYMILKAWLGK